MHLTDSRCFAVTALAATTIGVSWPRVASAGQHIICAPSVDTRYEQVDVLPGWAGRDRPKGKVSFSGVQAIATAGTLQEPWGELKDPPVTRRGEAVIVSYPLPKEAGKWVVCHYGDHLYRAIRLPGVTTVCEVTYKQKRVSDITCK